MAAKHLDTHSPPRHTVPFYTVELCMCESQLQPGTVLTRRPFTLRALVKNEKLHFIPGGSSVLGFVCLAVFRHELEKPASRGAERCLRSEMMLSLIKLWLLMLYFENKIKHLFKKDCLETLNSLMQAGVANIKS